MDLHFERHVRTGEYSHDEFSIDDTADDIEEAVNKLSKMQEAADSLLVVDDTPPQQPYPVQPAPQQPQFAPQPQPFVQPQQPGALDWAAAERMTSPCGPSQGQPLHTCSDDDLQFIATKYKKGGPVKEAAALVLAARRMGQTAQHL